MNKGWKAALVALALAGTALAGQAQAQSYGPDAYGPPANPYAPQGAPPPVPYDQQAYPPNDRGGYYPQGDAYAQDPYAQDPYAQNYDYAPPGGVNFDYDSGGYCDQWGCPDDFWNMPVYYGPVFFGGAWYDGPEYYRDWYGRRQFWIHGGWHFDEWRGPHPAWWHEGRIGPALGLNFYRNNGAFHGRWDNDRRGFDARGFNRPDARRGFDGRGFNRPDARRDFGRGDGGRGGFAPRNAPPQQQHNAPARHNAPPAHDEHGGGHDGGGHRGHDSHR